MVMEVHLTVEAPGFIDLSERGEDDPSLVNATRLIKAPAELDLDCSIGSGDDGEPLDGVRLGLSAFHTPGEDGRVFHVDLDATLSWSDVARLQGFLAFALSTREDT
jgi:hypothetical protein